jgi:hypothetical protein
MRRRQKSSDQELTPATPVPPKKMVKWENNLKTVFHVPQECVEWNGPNLRKGTNNGRSRISTDRLKSANNGQPRICKQ